MKNGVSGAIIRGAAAGILAVTERDRGLDEFLDTLPASSRRSVSHLLFCYFRRKRFIDGEAGAFLARPPRPPVLALLRAATAQLYFQNSIAPESAVNVAVDAAKRLRASALVNAVLRRVLASRKRAPDSPGAVLPPELFQVWKGRFSPETLEELTSALLTEPLFAFRALGDAPPPAGATALPGWGGFRFFAFPEPEKLLDSEAFRRGDCYIQDPATSLAPSLPDYTQIRSALEVCAAPGGKTLMLAERLAPGSEFVAADRSEKRQKLTRENCALRNVNVRIAVAEPEALSGEFDLVLADVPCGNSGVFRRRPDAMWRYSASRQAELVKLQRRILAAAARRVAPGGQLVYSTCSIEPEENELQISAFLERAPDFSLLKSRLLLPSLVNDGAFAALLIRRS